MSCTDDSKWQGNGRCASPSTPDVTNCVTWDALLYLRGYMNELHDLLDAEGLATFDKYGYTGDTYDHREEIETLAGFLGFYSLKLDQSGNIQEVYFKFLGGGGGGGGGGDVDVDLDIGSRLNQLGTKYTYDNSSPFGQWICYINDPTFGCTGFLLNPVNNPYPRSVVCHGAISNIDDPNWQGQFLYIDPSVGPTPPGMEIDDASSICNLNFDWRSGTIARDKFQELGKYVAKKYNKCYPVGNGCDDFSDSFACDDSMLAQFHLTEEGTPGDACDPTDLTNPTVYRWAKWVDVGAFSTLGGIVTQKIKAIHISDMWQNINALSGLSVRTCSFGVCGTADDSSIKLFGDSVSIDDLRNRCSGYALDGDGNPTGSCSGCSTCAGGGPNPGGDICACDWNELGWVLSQLIGTCYDPLNGSHLGQTVMLLGDIGSFQCCRTTDSKTSDDGLTFVPRGNWIGSGDKTLDLSDEPIYGKEKNCYRGGDASDCKYYDCVVGVTQFDCDGVGGVWTDTCPKPPDGSISTGDSGGGTCRGAGGMCNSVSYSDTITFPCAGSWSCSWLIVGQGEVSGKISGSTAGDGNCYWGCYYGGPQHGSDPGGCCQSGSGDVTITASSGDTINIKVNSAFCAPTVATDPLCITTNYNWSANVGCYLNSVDFKIPHIDSLLGTL